MRRILTAGLLVLALLLTACGSANGKAEGSSTNGLFPDFPEQTDSEKTQTAEAEPSGESKEDPGDPAAASLPIVDPIEGSESPKAETGPETESAQTTDESHTDAPPMPLESTTEPGSTESASGQESGAEPESTSGETGSGSDEESRTDPETEPPETMEGSDEPEPKAATEDIYLDEDWKYADESVINSGHAVLYYAKQNRRGIVVGVNAGHGTEGGSSVKTYCHPDHTEKVTGGTTAAGSLKAVAVSSGMDFNDGTPESRVTLRVAQSLKEILLAKGYDVLMVRDGSDVQLDNVARTVICNNTADCHIAIHYDDDGLGHNKGAYFMSVPNALKKMYPVSDHWEEHEELGRALIRGCRDTGFKVWESGNMDMDLTQTSYSTVPSVDIEMGNQCSPHDDDACYEAAEALAAGIDIFFGQ